MFCPKCGAEELNRVQFCRACGAELHTVRAALEQPDAITASAVTAREEIAHAIADKITEFESASDLRRAVEPGSRGLYHIRCWIGPHSIFSRIKLCKSK